ncbi:MAG: hypothetical protein EA382_16035 [Spirochaetaceae bacterium]|nr:MAG: hypothetical protein EA382_16035 [Spirochaetaceae bacterium]
MASCYNCQTELPERIYRNTTCDRCGRDSKVCLNCRFYDPTAHWECRETIGEPVRDKDRANFCDYFVAGGAGRSPAAEKTDAADRARATLNKLFGDD